MGAEATFIAMEKMPEAFNNIEALVAAQPPGFSVDRYDMPKIAHVVKIPTLLLQVKDDLMTKPFDMENIYANLGTDDKKLVWVEGTSLRFHGYTYFSAKPQEMVEWFNTYMK